MPSVTVIVLNSMGVPPAARMPSLDLQRQFPVIVIAGRDFNPAMRDTYKGSREVFIAESDGLEVTAAPARGPGHRAGFDCCVWDRRA